MLDPSNPAEPHNGDSVDQFRKQTICFYLSNIDLLTYIRASCCLRAVPNLAALVVTALPKHPYFVLAAVIRCS